MSENRDNFSRKYKRYMPNKFTPIQEGEEGFDLDDFLPLHQSQAVMLSLDSYSCKYKIRIQSPAHPFIGSTFITYEVLKKTFERPDYFVRCIDENNNKAFPHPHYWRYLFYDEKNHEVIYEIRQEISRLWLNIWISNTDENQSLPEKELEGFWESYVSFIEKNKQHINPPVNCSHALLNVFSSYITSGDALLNLKPPDDRLAVPPILSPDIKPRFNEKGYDYLSAAMHYLIALEGFANFLLSSLCRKEFRSEPFKRITYDLPIDLRLMTLPNWCVGFNSNGLKPDSEEYKKLKILTKFRNDIFHGNVTEEHKIYHAFQDGVALYYHKSESMEPGSLPRRREDFGKSHALYVRSSVQEIVTAIVNGMETECKEWVKQWLNTAMIMFDPQSDKPPWEKSGAD